MDINTYKIVMGDITVNYAVTAAGCVPVLESTRGRIDGSK